MIHLGAVLYVYQGEWGLPSVDLECIRAMCLAKFTRCPIDIETKSNPLNSGAGKLPYLQIGNEKFVGYNAIKNLLDKEGYPIDESLKKSQYKLCSAAYTDWTYTNLHPYFNYCMYGEANNFDLVRALYAKRTPFPFNFYYPGTYQKQAQDVLEVMMGLDCQDKNAEQDTDYMVLVAKKCVTALSHKLGRHVWFFGDTYSEFDSIAYAYLSLLLKVSLPNNPLQNHIKGCTNLVNFVNRITKDIFKQEAFSSNKTRLAQDAADDSMLTPTERKFLETEGRTKMVAGITAIAAMAAYSAWKGILNPLRDVKAASSLEDYDEDDELEYD